MENDSHKIYPIIGMSPGNSYFKDDEINYLLKKVVEKYGRVAIMIADIPAISTYIALGYSENRARRDKAIPQGNLLKNKTKNAMVTLGYDDRQVVIIDWKNDVDNNQKYHESYQKLLNLYNNNTKFREDVEGATRNVLIGSKKILGDIDKSVKIAVHYLLSEFAFLDWAPDFFNVEKIAYVYHKNWLVYENYIAGKYDGVVKHKEDFVLLENPWETFNTIWGQEDFEENNDDNKDSLDRVENTNILRVAFSNYPPALIHNNENGDYLGIFYEVITTIAKKYGWKVVLSEETGYGVIAEGLENNRFDVFGSTVWPTPERKEKASFSESLYSSSVFSWVRNDFNQLEGEIKNNPYTRVVVKEGDISHSIAKVDYPKCRLVYVPQLADPIELLEFVSSERGDLTFAETYLVEYFNKTSVNKLVRNSEEPVRIYENTFMFKKNDVSLRNLFNKEIELMREDGFIKKLIVKYTGSENTFIEVI